jgi:serine/threonine protein kinase
MHRDVKPDNLCLNPQTGLASLLDFGCMMETDGTDYCRGGSANYIPTELAVPQIYLVEDLRRAATFSSSDTFLAARVIYEMLLDIPAAINLFNYDPDDPVSFASYLSATRSFDWSPGLVFLQSNGLAPAAQCLAACLEPDPLLRPSPQQALELPFLAAVADEVDAAVAAAMPSYVAGNRAAVQLMQCLQGQDFTYVTHHELEPSASNNSSSSSGDSRSADVASLAGEPTVAVPAADIRPQDVVCARSSSGSSSTPDTPFILESRFSCSSVGVPTSSSSRGVEQQQRQSAELIVCASAVCHGSGQNEQQGQHEVQGVQGQGVTCVGHQQQGPSAFSNSNGSSSRAGCGAAAACPTAELAVAAPAVDHWWQDAAGDSISSSSGGCRGSSLTPDPPFDVSARISHSSIGCFTEAGSRHGLRQQQFAQTASGVYDSKQQTKREERSVLHWAEKLFKSVAWNSNAGAISSSSSSSNSNRIDTCSAAAASHTVKHAVAVLAADSRPRVVSCNNISGSSLAHARLLSSACAAPTGALVVRQWQAAAAAAVLSSSSNSNNHLRSLLCMPPLGEAVGRRSMRSRVLCSGQSRSSAWHAAHAAAERTPPAAATTTAIQLLAAAM